MADAVDQFNSGPKPSEANSSLPLPTHRPNETPNSEPNEQYVQHEEALSKI
jgi:hypothetical protein